MELSRQRARKHALNQFKHVRTCVLARELCFLVRSNRAAFEKEDVRSCCELISKLCRKAGCEAPSGLWLKAAEAVVESEETYLKLCEESCKKCNESRRPEKPKPPRAAYVA